MLWPEAKERVSKHTARLAVTLTGESAPVSDHILLTKVVHSLLEQKSAIGVFLEPGLFESSYYVERAEGILDGDLPTELWVHINAPDFGEGETFTFYTTGMRKFEKEEFEIIETKKNFIDAYYFLKELIKYTIKNDMKYKDGDVIGTEENKISLSVTGGVNVNGMSVMINI